MRRPRIDLGCFLLSAIALGGCEQFTPPPDDSQASILPQATTPAPAAKRFTSGSVVFRQTAIEAGIREALDRSVPALKYIDVQLDAVVDDLSRTAKIPIGIDIEALTADGKGSETIINAQVAAGAMLRHGLNVILEPEGLTYVVVDDRLLITTKTAAEWDRYSSLRIYRVHDLVNPAAPSGQFAQLIELITSTIRPESWREAGGTEGEIRPYLTDGLWALVVTHHEPTHEMIEDLLAAIREAREAEDREQQAGRQPYNRF